MMKKKALIFLLTAALCAAALLWVSTPRLALLENGAFPDGPDSSSSIEIGDSDVPLSDAPEPDGEPNPEPDVDEPFAQFTEDQLTTMNEVLDLVNKARSDAGLEPLELDPALCAAAQVRAKECVGTFSHTRPNGTKYKTAISESGVVSSYTGENVATGHTSAKQVVDAWMRSEGHKANILNAKFTRLGVGFAPNTGNRYRGFAWSQLFVQ